MVVVALAAVTMLSAPLALLHGGAASTAATAPPSGARHAVGAASLGSTQLLANSTPVVRATPAELARHRSAVRHNAELRAAAMKRALLRHHAEAVQSNQSLVASDRAYQALLRHHLAAVRANEALRAQDESRHLAALRAARAHEVREPRLGAHRAVGIATWYAWHPGQCASPFLPHGTLITVTDLATGKTITCLVTDTEAHNPGRVVDLSDSCFAELAPLSQGVIQVRITW